MISDRREAGRVRSGSVVSVASLVRAGNVRSLPIVSPIYLHSSYLLSIVYEILGGSFGENHSFSFWPMLTFGMKSSKYAFSVFTFDAAAGVLKRNDRYLRVPPQTLLLLTALLERAGAVITREHLRQLLWPEGEFIDHEHAINRAMNYLRSVLRDDPKKPQFIETLPKRGYRFIAEVTYLPEEAQQAPEVMLETDRPSLGAPHSPDSYGTLIAEVESTALQLHGAAPIEDIAVNSTSLLHADDLALSEEFQAELSRTQLFHGESSTDRRLSFYFARGAAWFLRPPIAYGLGLGTIIALLLALFVLRSHKSVTNDRSMGIVPFEVHGAQAEQMEESFRMDLTDTLSQLPKLQLHASHSLDHVKTDDASLMAISKSLQLDLLLLGKLTIEDGHCVLLLELVRGRDALHLASYQYSGTVQELATIRDKAQRDIFSGLQLSGNSAQASAGSTQNPEAYSFYLRGRELASRRTVATLNSAVSQYLSATERDPSFARAYAGMATAYLSLGSLADPVENLREAKLLAEKAERMNTRVAEAHAVLGFVAIRKDWNIAMGEAELRRAVELEPNEAAYHAWLAEFLADEGHADEALHEIDIARADDPLWPQIIAMDVFVSGAAHQYARGVEAAKRNVALSPNSSFARDQLAWSLFDAGRIEEAIHEWRDTAVLEKDDARVALEDRGLAEFLRGGPTAYAAVRLSAIQDHLEAASTHPDDFIPEEWYAYVGDRDHAIAALQQTIDRHDPSAIDFAVNPMLDNLHQDPQFLSMLSRVGLSLPASAPQTPAMRASLH